VNLTCREGTGLAEQQQLDLVEVSPTATPPVCRIMDYGKFKYQQSKKQQESKKKQVHVEVKEVSCVPRPMITTSCSRSSMSGVFWKRGTRPR
jgi:translation initiation factor IF-3